MKHSKDFRNRLTGFTLIELLVVISIIGILAGLIIPTVARAKVKGQEVKARTEMGSLIAAINSYEGDNNRMPASKTARASANPGNPDFTFGTLYTTVNQQQWTLTHPKFKNDNGQPQVLPLVINRTDRNPRYDNCNAEVMAALLGRTTWANGELTFNAENAMNPKKYQYLDVKENSGITQSGLGEDGVYRDPWGIPYIVTLDLDYDGRCLDAFYRLTGVSSETGGGGTTKGLNGLYSMSATDVDGFQVSKKVMAWSFGADTRIDASQRANVGVNRDNILSW